MLLAFYYSYFRKSDPEHNARFIESLGAKIYSTPPSIEKLSELFQDFYGRSATHIATHVSILASRLSRGTSPPPSASRNTAQSKRNRSSTLGFRKDEQANSETPATDQQMLTATEVAERRKARKLLQYKGNALEEAVERRACESIYDKIWRHRTTLDEVRDEKLRSKTAALQVMEFDLKDLGIDISPPTSAEKETDDSGDWLAGARQNLIDMNEDKFPLGKLRKLIAAHKAIVDSLTKILPSTSSADEILPILIYALITSPPEGINIISNLLFIQRFRASCKIDGEAAYCLTNLEAAISFLENIDLSNLRGDNPDSASLKTTSSGSSNPVPTGASSQVDGKPPSTETPEVTLSASQSTVDSHSANSSTRNTTRSHLTAGPSPQRRLTSLFQPPAKALGAANDAVRTTADQGLKNISSTLDNSFNFFFGRLKEVQMRQDDSADNPVTVLPRTLDDARRLVNPADPRDDASNFSEDSSAKEHAHNSQVPPSQKQGDKLMGLIGGRKPPAADRGSGNDTKKANSNEAVAASTSTSTATASGSMFSGTQNQTSSTTTPFGTVKNFGNSLNPLNHIPGMIRGLGRSPGDPSSSTTGLSSPGPGQTTPDSKQNIRSDTGHTSKNNVDGAIDPPIKKFLEMSDPSELKLGDIPELLEDYKRLSLILNNISTS